MTNDQNGNPKTRVPGDMPILQLSRLNYVRTNCRLLAPVHTKLEQYIAYASTRLETEITPGDVIEHGLKLLFDRDAGFREWLRHNRA